MIFLTLIIIILIIIMIILLKQYANIEKNNKDLEEKINTLYNNSIQINNQVVQLQAKEDVVQTKINGITQILVPQGESINKNISNQLETFKEIQSNLMEVAKQTEHVQTISTQIKGLEKIFINKNERGILGEVQLKNVLESVLGDNKQLFETQYSYVTNGNNSVRVDAIVHVPDPVGKIPIDSKFPLEAFLNGNDKQFIQDVKKHINDIKQKYIDKTQKITQAIMFIPSESIYNRIIQKNYELIEYGQKINVWICSPTTLIAVLNIIQVIFIHKNQIDNFDKINQELIKLANEFDRLEIRWKKHSIDIDKVIKDKNDIEITTQKIIKQFKKIAGSNDESI